MDGAKLPQTQLEAKIHDLPEEYREDVAAGKITWEEACSITNFIDRRGLGQKNRNPVPQPPNRNNTSSPNAYSPSLLGPAQQTASTTISTNEQAHQNNQGSRKLPFFFREEYSQFIVKGNFMTLAARPHLIEEGEWLAHQIVEQNRLLTGMLLCVQEKDRTNGRPTCNDMTCPTMTAGPTTYTWIDTKGNPINIPAPTYIKNIQTWVGTKIQDPALFPTDNFTTAPPLPRDYEMQNDPNWWRGKSSGFPQRFEHELKGMYKQMFRCYAHLYFQHWLSFWEWGAHRELNTCFMHFISVGRLYALLSEKDYEPMAPLVDLWVKQGVLPKVTTDETITRAGTGILAGAAARAEGAQIASGSDEAS